MTKEVENHVCEFCESQYKLSYSLDDTSGFSKCCPFCGSEINDREDETDADEE